MIQRCSKLAVIAGIVAACLSPTTLHASGSNALDRIDFGNSSSESSHGFNPAGGTLPPEGYGALGLSYRQPYGASSTLTSQTELVFTLTCSSTLQNYLTVKLWGSDNQQEYLMMSNAPSIYGAIDSSGNGGPAAFPGRFQYETIPIPISMTQGKTTVQITLYPTNADTLRPARPIYSAFSHTAPQFIPDSNDATGVKPTQDGFITPVALTNSQVISLLEGVRQNIYDSGDYYDTLVAHQIPAGTSGAPPEVIGLHLNNTIANEVAENPTPEQWRNDAYNSAGGPGYSKFPDEMISAFVSTYFLQPFKDVNGNTVAGLDHYHDSTIITRIVSALDGCSYLQVSDGGFGQNYNEWQGLCSTPRDSTSQWPGTTARAPGWSISLEGVDSETLGYTIIKLLNDSTAAPIFQSYLAQSYNANFTGTQVLRATAYEQMLSNHIKYLYNVSGGTQSQNMFEQLGMYACQIALNKLQALYPNSSYLGVGSTAAVNRLEMVMGLVQESGMAGTDPTEYPNGTGLVNYGLTPGGFGEAHGSLSCGYDGRYGTILPWLAPRFTQLASWDSNVSSQTLTKLETAAKATIEGYDHFVSPEENYGIGTTTANFGQTYDHFTLAQEDFITYRDPYNPNADGALFQVNSQYLASDPTGVIKDPYAVRSAYLQALYGITPSTGAGGEISIQYLKDLAAYESSLRALIGVNPSTLQPLQGETSQPNSAFVDPQSGATAAYYNGERFYLNANWRNFETQSPQQFGTVSNLARIHMTTGNGDIAALVFLPHDSTTVQPDGNLTGALSKGWIVSFGAFIVAGNDSTASINVKLPSGSGSATELVSGKTYSLGSTVPLAAGIGAVFVLPGAGGNGNGTTPLLTDGWYTLTNRASGLLADDKGNGNSDTAPVDQAAATGGFIQKWLLTNLGGNKIRLENAYSNRVMEVLYGYNTQGQTIDQYPYGGGTNQIWQLASLSGGYYSLTAQNSNMVLEDPGFNSSPGTVLDQWPSNGGTNQQWTITPTSLIASGSYKVANQLSSYVWQAQGAVVQGAATGGTNQKWAVANYTSTPISYGGTLISLADAADNNAASILYGSTEPGGQLYENGGLYGGNALYWAAPSGGGNVSLTGISSGLALDNGGSTTAGTNILQQIPAGTSAQGWLFTTSP